MPGSSSTSCRLSSTVFGLGSRLREVDGEREHKLRVYSELVFGHQVNKPAKGTSNYNRTCMPYPFKARMTAEEASSDFHIAIEGFQKTAYYKPGAPYTDAKHFTPHAGASHVRQCFGHTFIMLCSFCTLPSAACAAACRGPAPSVPAFMWYIMCLMLLCAWLCSGAAPAASAHAAGAGARQLGGGECLAPGGHCAVPLHARHCARHGRGAAAAPRGLPRAAGLRQGHPVHAGARHHCSPQAAGTRREG